MKAKELPEKYKTCDWLWNYGSIGLTKEHIKRLNNAINILESFNEHTDAKYLKEIKGKLLENAPEPKIVKITDVFIDKALKWYCLDCECNGNCIDTKCFFYHEYERYLKGDTNAIPPKLSDRILNEDGSISDNYHYRHFIVKMQDIFIEKAISWLKEQDEIIGVSFQEDFLERFKNYMKGE